MPKYILTAEQQAQILAGETELDLGEAPPAAGTAAAAPAKPAASAAAAPAAPAAAAPAAAPSLVDYLTAQVAEKDAALIDTKAKMTSVEAALAAAIEAQGGLVKIAQAVVGQMQVALGGTNSAAALGAKDVVAEYERVLPAYTAKLPVGGVSKPATDDSVAANVHPLFAERLSLLNTSK